MKNFLLLTALSGLFQVLYSQSWFPLSHSLSAGGTSVTDTRRNSVFQNPALRSYKLSPQLAAEYEHRYAITELASKGLSFLYPFTHFTSSVDFRYSGFSAYHEMLAGIGFARNFGSKFSIGLQFITEARYAVEPDRYHLALFPQIGLAVPLSETLLIGITAYNPFIAAFHYESEVRDLPSVYSLGLSCRLAESVFWRPQADQEISNRLRSGTSVDFLLLEKIAVQAGVMYNDSFVPSLGLGFSGKNLLFDLTVAVHPLLGLSLAGGLTYQWKN